MIPPDQDEMAKLRIKPPHHETENATTKRNHAFTYLVEHVIPGVRGAKNWKETSSSVHLVDTDVTPSDIAFGILVYENMRDKWDKGEDASKSERGKYTSTGSNRKFSGWSSAGISSYNNHFAYAVRNQGANHAEEVEEEVMMSLKNRHFKRVSLDLIRSNKTRRKKRRLNKMTSGGGQDSDDDEEGDDLPTPMWNAADVTAV